MSLAIVIYIGSPVKAIDPPSERLGIVPHVSSFRVTRMAFLKRLGHRFRFELEHRFVNGPSIVHEDARQFADMVRQSIMHLAFPVEKGPAIRIDLYI